jgi:hypothetical protein
MTTQNYLIVENNIVNNICVWDGDTNTWQPPIDATMLIQATTPAMVWEAVITDGKVTDYVLTETIGAGAIGFTWNGSVLTVNQPKPNIPTQPTTTGTQTA